ncbi:MAG TPA: pilin [Verrucomicrobiae bacterium]|nr:pilin [Verrucomicrobiae bacterium]
MRLPKFFSICTAFASLGLVFAVAAPVSAAGNYCWCRDAATRACSNYRGNQVLGGSHTADDPFTNDQCNAYCFGLSTPGHSVSAVSYDTTYRADTICAPGNSYGCEAGAASCSETSGSSGTPTGLGSPTPANAPPIQLYNPLGPNTDIPAFIGRGIRGVLGLIGAVALLMFIYGGALWMTAGGDSKRVEGAKSIIKNSVIGLVLIFFSYSLIGVFFSFFAAR